MATRRSVGPRSTDSNGVYCFRELESRTQPISSFSLRRRSAAMVWTAKSAGPIAPGVPGLLIDAFVTTQSATAVPPAPAAASSTRVFGDEQEVLGRERDIVAILDSGDGEVRVNVNPFGSRPTMRYNADVAVTGSGTVVWDGVDNDAGQISMGLGGRDLDAWAARRPGLALRIGAGRFRFRPRAFAFTRGRSRISPTPPFRFRSRPVVPRTRTVHSLHLLRRECFTFECRCHRLHARCQRFRWQ